MRRLVDLPLLVLLLGAAGLAMLVPAGYALIEGESAAAENFALSALIVLVFGALLGVATQRYDPRDQVRSQMISLVGAYLLLPPVLALPMAGAVPGLGFAGAWFEMVSAFTTTGATVIEAPETVARAVHLWRSLVGWLGGFFVLLVAIALLAPLNLGGLEVETGRAVGRAEPGLLGPRMDGSARLLIYLRLLAPLYGGLTLALWLGLVVAGDEVFTALCHAMAILSTSGITPLAEPAASGSGRLGEALMLGFLIFAITRRSLPGRVQPDQRRRLRRDPELHLAALVVGVLSLAMFLRHWLGAAPGEDDSLAGALRAIWGSLFTLTSFLTTTGFISGDWEHSRAWAGLTAPGLLLAGVALIGGGVATTSGGIKLLRLYALYRQGWHEMEKLVHPNVVAGGGGRARKLRREGAYAAWIAFMLFLLTLALTVAALSISGAGFEVALIYSVASVTTTGPLVAIMGEAGPGFAGLNDGQRALLALAMTLGRLEMLAIVALLVPESWRR
ncbi:TrkH family potassium uptake protein [Alkalilacustris brevis]|uniref:TrkH family potassium uptake protein n=1 Tax=Alkalilacustris brevis TaxID=2026338 RepID=UPI000E0D5747|nr:potassium transporter TrkG [Alkalilacustris brevis]